MQHFGIIGRTYRHVQRYRQILTVLFKYGFGDLIEGLNLEQYYELGLKMITRRKRERVESMTRAERVRRTLQELGPTFVKMGQILSTRPDLLPLPLIKELERLQYDVAAFPYEDAKRIIETELQRPLKEVYSEFGHIPLAAASIGQVHKATLHTGEHVVVKVQRPGIKQTIDVDIEIMYHMAKLMERYLEGWEIHQPTMIVQELAHTFEQEIDYLVEAAHLERFAREFEGNPTVHVPKVYREYSTTRVLTLEYIEGIRASDVEQLDRQGYDRPEIARRGADLIMSQIFVAGFFHADPHPGNIFVLPGNVVCYVDFGMVGRIDRKTREDVANLVMAVVRRDESRATDAILRLTSSQGQFERRFLERDVAELMDQYTYRPIKEIEFGKLLQDLFEISGRYSLRAPADLFLMIKALSTAESVARDLDPEFDITRRAAPFIRRVIRDRYHPQRIARDAIDSAIELASLLRDIPGETREILQQAKQGHVRFEFEHRGLEPMLLSNDRISNRISFSIVLASQIIGSSLIILADIPPKWNEIPVIGLFGFLVALIMGFWLLGSILRHGRL